MNLFLNVFSKKITILFVFILSSHFFSLSSEEKNKTYKQYINPIKKVNPPDPLMIQNLALNTSQNSGGMQKDLILAYNNFSFDLFSEMAIRYPDITLQPIHWISFLGALHSALDSDSKSKSEISNKLKLDFAKKEFANSQSVMMKGLYNELSQENHDYKQAVSFFSPLKSDISIEYLAKIGSLYRIGVLETDYSKPDKSSLELSEWIKEESSGMISFPIKKDDINAGMNMYLMMFSYFHPMWSKNSIKDEKQVFYVKHDQKIETTMTTQIFGINSSSRYFSDNNVEVVEVPLSSNNLSLTIIMGKAFDNKDKITRSLFAKLRSNLKEKPIVLSIPKIDMNTDINVDSVLKLIGINNLFSSLTSFSKMKSEVPLHLSKATCQSKFVLNEKGSQNNSVENVSDVLKKAKDDKFQFVLLDKPFYFFVRDNKTGVVIFMGKLTNPSTYS